MSQGIQYTTMNLSQAYTILGLAPGATKADIDRAFRAKALAHHPDRIPRSEDEAEQAAKIQEATEAMKAVNNAKALLMTTVVIEDEDARSQFEDDNNNNDDGGFPFSYYFVDNKEDESEPHPRRFTKRDVPPDFDLAFDSPMRYSMEEVNSGHFPVHGVEGKVAPYSEEAYVDLIGELADLHSAFCKIVDAIRDLSPYSNRCMGYWFHIWNTLRMAGVTIEGVCDIVVLQWPVMTIEKGGLRVHDFERVQLFVKIAKAVVSMLEDIVSPEEWDPADERWSCFQVYTALGAFLIAKEKLRDTEWQYKNRLMRILMQDDRNKRRARNRRRAQRTTHR